VDVFVIDGVDASLAPAIEEIGLRVVACDTIMEGIEEAAAVAKAVIDAV
jgi:hypothetical protein